MSVGSLKTLFTTLSASALLSGVSLSFGEELVAGLDRVPPLVDIVPVGGPWTDTGYARGVDPDQNGNAVWMTTERIDLYCYGWSNANGATAIDHADAVETLRNQVLQALMDQADTGLYFKPVDGAWVTASSEISRFGRAYRISMNVDISVLGVAPVDATVTSVTLNQNI